MVITQALTYSKPENAAAPGFEGKFPGLVELQKQGGCSYLTCVNKSVSMN